MLRRSPNIKKIERLAQNRRTLPHRTVSGLDDVFQAKEDIVSGLLGVTSLRDFGGCWIVEGRYLLEPARALDATFVSMVEHGDTTVYEQRAAEAATQLQDAEFETVNGDFRNPDLFTSLCSVEASILYEVLLHQENYVEVIRNVTNTTSRYVCVAQPCLRESFFALPSSSTLLQFWDEALKDELREGSFWTEEQPMTKFHSSAWMWGHSTSHLIDVFAGFEWVLEHGEVIDGACGLHWEYPLLVFRAPE